MANLTKRGLDLILKAGTTPIGGQRNASIEMSSEVLDVSCKTTGDWAAKINGAKSWTCSCDGIYFTDDTGYKAAVAAFMNGTEVDLELSDAAKKIGFKGKAIILILLRRVLKRKIVVVEWKR